MDKIICDVCGTGYPESSESCPICGSPRRADASHAMGQKNANAGYTYVKGGRFSSSNVRRRSDNKVEGDVTEKSGDRKKSNFVVGIFAIIFLVLIIGTLVFFIIKILNEHDRLTQPDSNSASQSTKDESNASVASEPSNSTDEETMPTESTSAETEPSPTEDTIPEETYGPDYWELNREDITFVKVGETWDLYSKNSVVSKSSIAWTSEDDTIVKVENGVAEAVGSGKAYVYAEYDGVKKKCLIRCKFEENSTDGSTEEGNSGITISHEDVSLEVDETFRLRLKDESGKELEVEWKAGTEGVVEIEGNKITAVQASSRTTVSCVYEGKTYSCIVRVRK